MNRFRNRVAIITGAGEGIGAEIARQLVGEGASIILNDLDPQKAGAMADELGPTCFPVPGNAADLDLQHTLIEAAVSNFGQLDLLVANAGLTLEGDFLTYTETDFDRVTGLNLRGSCFLAQAAARQIISQTNSQTNSKNTGGSFLFMSSVCGHIAAPGLGVYGMTKAALEHLARVLAVELGPSQITVNALAPGATIVPRNLANDPNYAQYWAALTPQGRCPTVDDMAHAALFLLDPTSDVISGQSLIIDGGWSRKVPL